MTRYLNEDGSRYRMFGDRLDPWEERDNPYWIVNKTVFSMIRTALPVWLA